MTNASTRVPGSSTPVLMSVLALAACTASVPVHTGGPDPVGDAGSGAGSSASHVDASGTTDSGTTDSGSPCAFQPGTYQEAFATTDTTCSAIASQTLTIGPTGIIDPGPGCTSSATAACVTTIACSGSSGQTTTTSMLVVTTGGTFATGTETIQTDTSAPPGCAATIFCPAGYCLYGGFCYPLTYSQTCTYDVTFTKT